MNEAYKIVSESMVFSQNDLTLHLNKWKQGIVKSLFIIGYLGSGKSVSGRKIAKQYNATYIELDVYRDDEMDKLAKKKGIANMTDEESESIWDEVFDKLEQRIKLGNERLVIEGVDLLFMNRQLVLEQAVIIKGTSAFKSTYRAWVRNMKHKSESGYRNKNSYQIMMDTVKNQKHFSKHIDKFVWDVEDRKK
jgi:shikimate kinase